tara:strand:+ start:44 stop:619 length:576 start_codon:yes stop_codon:yes gene_type:complete
VKSKKLLLDTLKEQKRYQISLYKSGKREYSKSKKRPNREYNTCPECFRILHFTQYRKYNTGWEDKNLDRRLYKCKKCEEKWQKDKRDKKPWWRLNIMAKGRAKKKNLEYNIDEEYIKSIWPKDNKCPILGTEFKSGLKNKHQLPTLDKIKPQKGYVKGNVAVISFRANQIKSDVNDFEVFKKIYDFYKKSK